MMRRADKMLWLYGYVSIMKLRHVCLRRDCLVKGHQLRLL